MFLSIITINLNNAIGLQKTMESVFEQTNHDYEWIVIDGGSTDGSVSLLECHRDRIQFWKSEPDGGIYSAMNKGIRASKGEYLLFLNSGDCFANKGVVDCFHNQHHSTDFVVGRSITEGDDLSVSTNRVLVSSLEETIFRLCVSAFLHQATFIRRNTFQKYGLYREDKKLASDWFFSVNALIKGSASVSNLPILVAVCEKDGISSRMHQELYKERQDLINENPGFAVLFNFYRDNRDIVAALKDSRSVFFLFRVYYFFYRKLKRVLP